MGAVTKAMGPFESTLFGVQTPAPAPVYVPAPPTPPAQDPTALAQQAAASNAAVAAVEAGGKASTVLTGPLGTTNQDKDETIARKTLLGSA